MKRYSTIMSVLLTLALPVAATCADAPKASEKADASTSNSMSKGGHSSMMGMSAAPAPANTNVNPAGKVVETMNGGGYTYANLDGNGTKSWVAYPVLDTRVGDTLSFKNCLPMTNFQSKTLSRTFENILFCSAPEIGAATKTVAAAGHAAGNKKAAVGKVKVDKAQGANAYTIEEIYAKSKSLHGKQVMVKGQVVKVASGIMGRNWIHLQDGSGSDSAKTNDLTVTSDQMAEVGDLVTVSGTLAKDKDFGGGYKYAAIIEKASIKK